MERQRCSECAAFNALNNECRREAPKPALIIGGRADASARDVARHARRALVPRVRD
jgi:hypothetical protein